MAATQHMQTFQSTRALPCLQPCIQHHGEWAPVHLQPNTAFPTGGALHESEGGLQASLSKYLYHVSPGGAGGMLLS